VAQTGCGALQTCTVLGGFGLTGTAAVCVPAGAASAGAACSPDVRCLPGLVCYAGACRAFCNPAAPACTSGSCQDLSATLALALGTVGICR
jgi:hypothetical protein